MINVTVNNAGARVFVLRARERGKRLAQTAIVAARFPYPQAKHVPGVTGKVKDPVLWAEMAPHKPSGASPVEGKDASRQPEGSPAPLVMEMAKYNADPAMVAEIAQTAMALAEFAIVKNALIPARSPFSVKNALALVNVELVKAQEVVCIAGAVVIAKFAEGMDLSRNMNLS